MTFRKLREQSGMTLKQFSEHFMIPLRTVENWSAGVNKCPDYLLSLLKNSLFEEERTMKFYSVLAQTFTEDGVVLSSNHFQCLAKRRKDTNGLWKYSVLVGFGLDLDDCANKAVVIYAGDDWITAVKKAIEKEIEHPMAKVSQLREVVF